MEDLISIMSNARETGMNFLNNARNSMIDNFRSIKWLYHELEEFRARMGSLENKRKKLDYGNLNEQGDHLSLGEKRIQNLENYNHNLPNQMVSILTFINDNISSLTRMLKARGLLDENKEKDRARDRMEEDMMTKITFSTLDQDG